jgi:GTP-binding protein HflX
VNVPDILQNQRERAVLVGVAGRGVSRYETDDSLEELALLAETAGAEVIDRVVQERTRIDPTYYIGRGKAEFLGNLSGEQKIDVIIFDDDLSPAQAKNLGSLGEAKIIDRSGLILDIFARRARTREARTQVELAQLRYLLPRLTRQWTHFSRQVGGIGTRGPGETQLETDRRLIRSRIRQLEKELEKIERQRDIRRQHRGEAFKVALVGYTNAGKSTLLNALTGAGVFVEDQLFATLDPTVRAMPIGDHKNVVLIDTVGFIRKLPHHLVASFKSTLDEVRDADLLLHVIDVTHPGCTAQINVVNDVLKELGVAEYQRLHAFNKVDALQEKGQIARLQEEYAPAIFISAQRGIFIEELKTRIAMMASAETAELDIDLCNSESALLARLHELGKVTQTEYGDDNRVHVRVRVSQANAEKIRHLLAKNHQQSLEATSPMIQ